MTDRAAERVDLLKTDAELAAGEVRIGAQSARVEQLHMDSLEAELLLQAMCETFEAGREHRRLLLIALDDTD